MVLHAWIKYSEQQLFDQKNALLQSRMQNRIPKNVHLLKNILTINTNNYYVTLISSGNMDSHPFSDYLWLANI